MKQSVALITLGVADVQRATKFYRALGWSPALEIDETLFFQANGVVLVLWARDKLAGDMGIDDSGKGWGGMTLAHNVGSRQEVDEIVEQARRAGAVVTRAPAVTFYGGYAATGSASAPSAPEALSMSEWCRAGGLAGRGFWPRPRGGRTRARAAAGASGSRRASRTVTRQTATGPRRGAQSIP